jgi:hypothetical protein
MEAAAPFEVTEEQAAFAESKAREMFDYVAASLDAARAEGRSILGWLFAVVAGGVGLAGTVAGGPAWPAAAGALLSSAWAAWVARSLGRALHSADTMPPGNLAANIRSMFGDPPQVMRWREALAMDARILANNAQVARVASAVDLARARFSRVPALFVAASLAAWALARF